MTDQTYKYDTQPLDRSLAELRTGRQMEQLAASMERFLLSQVERISDSLEKCRQAVNQNQILHRMIADFESQKSEWESQRQAESIRLYEAGERLIEGWEKLEMERRMLHGNPSDGQKSQGA